MNIIESDQAQLLGIFATGAARSAEKFSELYSVPWSIDVVSLDIGSGERFRSILARDQAEHLGVHFSAPGERYLVIFSEVSGKTLLNASIPVHPGGRRPPPDLEQSTLAEIANILVNALSGALADRQGMARILSAPTVVRDRKDGLYRRAFGGLTSVEQTMVDVLIHISSPALAADCTVMLRLDALSANFLLHTDPDAPGEP